MRNVLLISLCFFSTLCFAQNGKYGLGARSSGMGGASLILSDQWSIFNNVGALGRVEETTAFTSYQNRFNLEEFQVVGAGLVHKLGDFTTGAGFYRFGDDIFSEQRISFSVGHTLDRVSLGISVDYLQYNVSTVGNKGAMVLEFGGVAEITKKLFFGAHVFNLNQATLLEIDGERLPTIMKAGISFRPSDVLIINVETEKDLDFDEVFRLGLEYQIVSDLYLRTGFNTAPFQGAFGIGFNPKQFQFDYSYGNQTMLGDVHELSVSFVIDR